jgi:hypothetical protein
MHVALLGDAIFDNAACTGGEADVATHIRSLLPDSAGITLCAIDGSTTANLESQAARIPAAASHVVVSIGGNDVLRNADLLRTPVRSPLPTRRADLRERRSSERS